MRLPLRVIERKDWILDKLLLQCVECALLDLAPLPRSIACKADTAKVLDELVVEVCKAMELAYVGRVAWCRPLGDALHLHWVHLDTIVRHQHAQILELGDFELAFLRLAEQVIFTETFQDLFCHLMMCGQVVREDWDAVEIDSQFALDDKIHEDVIHEHGEHAGRIQKTKEHDVWLEETMACHKRSLPLIASFNLNVVVPPAYVQLCEYLHILELIHQLRDQRNWVSILHSDLIQVSIVLY